MDLRIRLERLGAAAFDEACGPAELGLQSQAPTRLLFLLAGCSIEGWQSTYRAIRLGAYVFRRTSDVLHGRVGGLNVPQVVLDEWRAVVDKLEGLASQQGIDTLPTATMGRDAANSARRGTPMLREGPSEPAGTVTR